MNVYLMMHHCGWRFVTAEDMGAGLALWRADMLEEFSDDEITWDTEESSVFNMGDSPFDIAVSLLESFPAEDRLAVFDHEAEAKAEQDAGTYANISFVPEGYKAT